MADNHDSVPVPEMLAPVTTSPAMVAPEMIVTGMHSLQERIPGFVQLDIKEKRSMARAAHLDPEFVRVGIHAACLWDNAPVVLGRTGEDMRDEEEEIRRWDDAIRSFSAILEGMAAANLKRKNHLGRDILKLYNILGVLVSHPNRPETMLRPYYEEMQRLYKEFAKPKKKKQQKE